jgi:hypothetical protein
MLARRREEGLVVREVDGETLVYDRRSHKAHCLNRAAALVWSHCDGATSVADLAQLLHQQLQMPADEAVVRLALDRLARAHLLAEPVEGIATERFSRRDLARKLGIATVMVPLIMSIQAPTAAAAGSGPCAGGPPCSGKTCAFGLKCKNQGGLRGGTCICVGL